MFGSKNDFFKQKPQRLVKARTNLQKILRIKSRKYKDIRKYNEAFDYFTLNPSEYDGATIVKDLVDIRQNGEYLDIDAMLHDYTYIKGASTNFYKKWKADVAYIKNMETNGKGIRVFRLLLLTITGIIYIPYKIITKK